MTRRSGSARHRSYGSAATGARSCRDPVVDRHCVSRLRHDPNVTTTPDQLVGRLTGVTGSWLHPTGPDRVPVPIHVWLTIDGLGTKKLHTPGAGSIAILDEPVHEPYAMDEIPGVVEVETGTPEVLSARIGQSIEAIRPLWQEPPGEEVGFILHFHDGDVGIANIADELTVLTWPDALWSKWGVSRVS